jgi:hypothetical protein
MVVIGLDAHKRTHTVVAVDGTGRKLAERTVSTSPAGHLELLRWARRWRDRTWALEDCRHLTRRLEVDLLAVGERVVRVPPKLMAGTRRSNREPGKSDPIDALSVARAALREPNLPTARLDGVERELRLLVDHREDLVVDRTGHQERLRWFLVELGIAEPPARSLDRRIVLDRLEAELAERTEPVARFARDLLARIRELTAAINALRERDPGPRGTDRAVTPGPRRLRSPDGRQARRSDGRHRPLPIASGLRPAQRHGSGPGLVGQHGPPSAQPRRRPSAQRGPSPDRDHPAPARGPGTRLSGQADGRRRHQDRSDPSPPTTPQRRGLSTTDHRRERPVAALRRLDSGRGLT